MPAPSPMVMAGRARTLHAEPPLNKRTEDVIIDGVPIIDRVVEIAAQHHIDLHDVAATVLDAEKSWPGLNGISRVYLRGPIAVIVPDDSFEVIAVAPRERALAARSEARTGSTRKMRGGGIGSRNPTTMAEFYAVLDEAGLVIARDSKHVIIRHPEKPGQVVASSTPSDHHSIPNAVHEIRRTFGLDLRRGAST